jgi:hypothetical protein
LGAPVLRADSDCQAVVIREQEANIIFFKKLVHEMIHFKSYNAVQITASANPQIREYRMGLLVHDRDGHVEYFRGLNEAVTEEITKEVVQATRHPLCEGIWNKPKSWRLAIHGQQLHSGNIF